jgi:hypothetical protein
MFPIRVLVESVRARHCLSCAHDGQPLLDSYAIVSGDTRLSQLVDTVLAALALPQLAYGARGEWYGHNILGICFPNSHDRWGSLLGAVYMSHDHTFRGVFGSWTCICRLTYLFGAGLYLIARL